MIKSFFNMLMEFLKLPLIIGAVIIGFFTLLIVINLIIELVKGKRFKKGGYNRYKKRSILHRLIIDFPHQKALDILNNDPDAFRYQGLIIFTGRQGDGKTISMAEFARRIQLEYPKSKLITNFAMTTQNDELDHWRMLVDYSNDKFGVCACIDETQNWFSSNQSRDFPPEMLQVITQNRKNRRIILGTAQNFYLLAKPIRSQCTEVRECKTLFGCITIVRRKQPLLDAEGNVKEWNKLGTYFYVHSDKLRSMYDTYRVIESLSKSGFKPKINISDV